VPPCFSTTFLMTPLNASKRRSIMMRPSFWDRPLGAWKSGDRLSQGRKGCTATRSALSTPYDLSRPKSRRPVFSRTSLRQNLRHRCRGLGDRTGLRGAPRRPHDFHLGTRPGDDRGNQQPKRKPAIPARHRATRGIARDHEHGRGAGGRGGGAAGDAFTDLARYLHADASASGGRRAHRALCQGDRGGHRLPAQRSGV
jgi:hypothetical protein